jgi:hypothetical protein
MDLSKTWCAMCWWRATWGHCLFELFSEHTFCWLFDIKHSLPGMLNSLDIPTFWYPWDFFAFKVCICWNTHIQIQISSPAWYTLSIEYNLGFGYLIVRLEDFYIRIWHCMTLYYHE